MNKTFWLFWQFENGKFFLIDWENNELAGLAAQVFWPYVSVKDLQDSVLLECHEKQKFVERDVSNQNLVIASKLPFEISYIKAIPARSDDYDNFIECEYTVGE